VITIVLSNDAALAGAKGQSFTLSPVPNTGAAITAWDCVAGGGMPAKYMPASCR
jgi:hypothetical protein